MFFHGEDRESLHAHIDPKYLPTTYGGTRPEYSYREWFESLGKNPAIIEGKSYKLCPITLNTPHTINIA